MNNNEILFIIHKSLEGGFEARALDESIFTEGESLDELKNNIREAVACHFENENMPKLIRLHYLSE